MVKEIIAKILNKPMYRAKITLVGENFDATHESNSLLDCLKWTMHGLYECDHEDKELQDKFGNIIEREYSKSSKKHYSVGQICEFKLFNVTSNSIGIFCYSKPRNEDMLFMSNKMVYVPEKILKTLKKQEVSISDLDMLFK